MSDAYCARCGANPCTCDDDRDVGPHTHVYVGTDRGDECEICGEVDRSILVNCDRQTVPDGFHLESDESDEWAYWNWVDAQHGWYLPDYDFEGGAG